VVRLALVIGLLTWGAAAGGWSGFFFMVGICTLLGFIWPYRIDPDTLRDKVDAYYDEIRPAKRGSEVDPTRPTTDDFAGMKFDRKERRNV
jgi:hypothetical protein